MKSYIGNKGYTVKKSELSNVTISEIKKELMVKPYVSQGEAKIYPVYRESENKLYLPRYYGLKKLGDPETSSLGENAKRIDVEFNGVLREKQELVVDTYLNKVSDGGNVEGGLLELPCAFGKCLGYDTDVIMYGGKIKKVQDVKVKDLLMGDDSTPRLVKSICRGKEQMYKIKNKREGTEYVCNESHILSLVCVETNEKVEKTVQEYKALTEKERKDYKGYKVVVNFESDMLGNYRENNQPSFARLYGSRFCNKSMYDRNKDGKGNELMHEYKCGSKRIRTELLTGVYDAVGEVKDKTIRIKYLPYKLLKEIEYVFRTLGFLCRMSHSYSDEEELEVYGVLKSEKHLLDRILEKDMLNKNIENIITEFDDLSYDIVVEAVGEDDGDYYGFEIDGNRRFVLGDLTVTHNTVLAINIISRLSYKTLIIVHKEFLLNQWVDRIRQFLPSARIGRIQGQKMDIDDKDIVIGMLQSLSMKEYPPTLFNSFGLTVIDEVHHISSEVFSKSLFKIVTKHTLGLSATMNRKDGTSHVFKMFLGDVIFKGTHDEKRHVTVRAIEYKSHDNDFEETVLDFRGKPAYSTMIKNICEYNRRTEFILRVLTDMLEENPKQQVMILAHNRSILTYFYDAIKHRQIASVGYYLGGMKEIALKETESKQIVIATYSMAAEALDIKTLTTLIMATPKTDIEQSVGRILREKHSNPIVVDIIDTHRLFKNQWQKRKTFYRKNNYHILSTNSDNYINDTKSNQINWATTDNKKTNKKQGFFVDVDIDDDSNEENKQIGKCLLKFKNSPS